MDIIHVFIQDRGAYKHSNVHFVFSYISILVEKILKFKSSIDIEFFKLPWFLGNYVTGK